jgi:hypothetical protein
MPGVFFTEVTYYVDLCVRLERDLYTRTDQMGVEIRERAKWDLREGMVSTNQHKLVKCTVQCTYYLVQCPFRVLEDAYL